MDLNKQKEHFSIAFIRALAAVAGVYVWEPRDDIESEDLVLGAKMAGSPRLAIQAKCTADLKIDGADFPFELGINDYDNLRDTRSTLARILVVVEVPPGIPAETWIDQKPDECCLRRSAYWLSLEGHRVLANRRSITVRIPVRQRLTPEANRDMMNRVARGERRFES